MLRILQHLIEALDLSVYSYIKPGSAHRYSLYEPNLHRYVKTFTSSLGNYQQAITLGESIAKGLLGFPSANVGRLITQSVSESISRLSNQSVVGMHLVLIPVTLAASYTISSDGGLNLSTFRKALTNVIRYSKVTDALDVYSALKKCGDYYAILEELGISEGFIEINSMNLHDLYTYIGRRDVLLNILANKQDIITGMALKFVNSFVELRDYNLATVLSYIEGLERVYGIVVRYGDVRSREFINELFKVDKDFRSRGLDFNQLIPILCASTFIALCIVE